MQGSSSTEVLWQQTVPHLGPKTPVRVTGWWIQILGTGSVFTYKHGKYMGNIADCHNLGRSGLPLFSKLFMMPPRKLTVSGLERFSHDELASF